MVSYVEFGVKFTNDYGDIDEPFYNHVANTFRKDVNYIVKSNLVNVFHERLKRVLEKTYNIGWGFPDDMHDIYYEYFPDE